MYAVIKTGGKQYRVAPQDTIVVEKLDGEAGGAVALNEVLMLTDGAAVALGAPFVAGASVAAEIVRQGRDEKVLIFKKRRRQNSRRRNGHRQAFTVLKITEISGLGKTATQAKAVPEPKAAKPKFEKPKKSARTGKSKAETAAETQE
jgi:large subunit ribosomal protein L21